MMAYALVGIVSALAALETKNRDLNSEADAC